MADLIGTISDLSGQGNVLIIRASGERVIAKSGDEVFQGDTVITSTGSNVRITVLRDGVQGTVELGSALSAQFDNSLVDDIESLLPLTSIDDPIAVGDKPSQALVDLFNSVFPSFGIDLDESAEASSQSDTVVDGGLEGSDVLASELFLSDPASGLYQAVLVDSSQLELTPSIGQFVTDLFNEPFSSPQFSIPNNPSPTVIIETIAELTDEQEQQIIIPIDAIDDQVSTTEDTPILKIDVLANDLVGQDAIDAAGSTSDNITTDPPVTGGGTGQVDTTTTGGLNDPVDPVDPIDPIDPIDPAATKTVSDVATVILPNGQEVRIELVSNTTEFGGAVTLNTDGTFRYDPAENFSGIDTFTYIVTSTTGASDTATVTITVAPASDTFTYTAADGDGSTETINYFGVATAGTAQADLLDLSDLLQDEENNSLSDYLTVTDAGQGKDVTIAIDADRSGSTDLTIVLSSIGTGQIDLTTLQNNNQIIADE